MIVRSFFPAARAEELATRLWSLKKDGRRGRQRLGQLPAEQDFEREGAWARVGGGNTYFVFGPDLLSYRGHPPARFANASQAFGRYLKHRRLWEPVEALHAGLRALGRWRHVRSARDVESRTHFSPGVFRASARGHRFGLHMDTLHSHQAGPMMCGGASAAAARAVGGRAIGEGSPKIGLRFADLTRFRDQFSALIVLRNQEPAALSSGSDELRAYDAHYRDCGLKSTQGAINVAVNEAHFRKTFRGRTSNLTLYAGDFYVFNSNYVHEVLPANVSQRLTLGSFVGIDDDVKGDVCVWA